MKRSPLKRTAFKRTHVRNLNARAPLARGGKLRHTSKKRAKLNREAKPLRDEWRERACAYLGCIAKADDVNEITRGPSRERALDKPYAVLAVCRKHHDEIQNWPLAKLLALKRLADPTEYNRVECLRLRVFGGEIDRMDNAVTEDEVTAAVAELLKGTP